VANLTSNAKLRKIIRKIALLNALNYEGKAQTGPVLGKLLAEDPHLKTRVKEVAPIITEVVREVNKLSLDEQRRMVEKKWPELKITGGLSLVLHQIQTVFYIWGRLEP